MKLVAVSAIHVMIDPSRHRTAGWIVPPGQSGDLVAAVARGAGGGVAVGGGEICG